MRANLEAEPIAAHINLNVDEDALNRQIKTNKESVLQFAETRLLTRGDGGDDPQKKIAEYTKGSFDELKALRRENASKNNVSVKVITGTA